MTVEKNTVITITQRETATKKKTNLVNNGRAIAYNTINNSVLLGINCHTHSHWKVVTSYIC